VGAEISMRWAQGPEDLRAAVLLREEVFCREQGVPFSEERDGLDHRALHLLALAPGACEAVGTLRVLVAHGEAKIGRVAVERGRRRRGVASRMLALAIDRARECGCEVVRLASQLEATALYEHAGFTVASETFEEAGIPHVWMILRLTAGA
jgi:predicted GNAT family N-acyltransferase